MVNWNLLSIPMFILSLFQGTKKSQVMYAYKPYQKLENSTNSPNLSLVLLSSTYLLKNLLPGTLLLYIFEMLFANEELFFG